MTDGDSVILKIDGEVATVIFNRPEKHNAFDEEMRDEITKMFIDLGKRNDVRAIILTGLGVSFSAGADLDWMRRVAGYTREQNIQDAEKLATMFHSVHDCPKPVIGKINGNALGGGAGLVSCCDIAIASEEAFFAFPEVKLGIIPAVISPIVLTKIGNSAARELFITGERFSAQKAYKIGLVSEIVPKSDLDATVDKKVKLIFSSGPIAVAECKLLLKKMETMNPDEFKKFTIEKIADLRSTNEGKEGMDAFLQKRKAKWVPEKQ